MTTLIKNLKLFFFSIILLFVFTSCSSTKINKTEKANLPPINIVKKHDFKIYKNKQVEKWIEYFSKKDLDRYKRFITRGEYYKEVIQTGLEEEELPYTLYYLPLIESGFRQRALSHAGAVGPWQFIKGTATRYGLSVNSFVDERRDPILSTEAATKYLSDLYNVFHSWELAIAAYNCGELRVLRAIMRGKTRNFWELSEKKLLPRETRNYVPKFLAAAYIGENLEEFQIDEVEVEAYPDVQSHDIPGGTKLSLVAKHLGMSYFELTKLNPSLKRKKTPYWLKNYSIWLPPKFALRLPKIASVLTKNRRYKKLVNTSKFYKVRRGDSLLRISRRYKVSLNKLRRLNKIKGSRIYTGQKLLVKSQFYKRVKGKNFYFVKKNDHLSKIARKYHISVAYLKKLNGIHSNHIYIGQKIDVSSGVQRFKYRVRKGDNLLKISKLYNTSTSKIKQKNSLRGNRIFVGQLLSI